MSPTPILSIQKVRKRYNQDLFKKSQQAVDDLSCDFHEGQSTALMGHNGAGKTTTIRMIFGLLKPDEGQILFRGQPISRNDRKLIGYMPEVNKLPLNLNCEELLHHQLRLYRPAKIKKEQIKPLIEKHLRDVELWEHRSKKIRQLSKGMGRRLAWAQATIHQPELLILDEPFSGLDPLGRMQMCGLIDSFRKQKKSLIICTHDLRSVEQVCDALHIVRQGKLVYTSLDEKDPSQELTKNFQLHLTGISRSELESIQTKHKLPDFDHIDEQGFSLQINLSSYEKAENWLQCCLKEGVIIQQFQKFSGLSENQLMHYFSGGQTL